MFKRLVVFSMCLIVLALTGCSNKPIKDISVSDVVTDITKETGAALVAETTTISAEIDENELSESVAELIGAVVDEPVDEVMDEVMGEFVDEPVDDTVITDADVINILSGMNDCSTKYILSIGLSVDTNVIQQFDTRGIEEPFYKVTERDITTISELKEKMSECFTESYLQDIFSGEYVGSVGLNYFYSGGTDGLYVCGDNYDAMNSNMSIRNYVEFDSFIQRDNEIEVILREDYDFDFDTNDFVKRDEANYYSIVFKLEGGTWKADSFVGNNCGYDEPNNYIMLYNAFKDGKIV